MKRILYCSLFCIILLSGCTLQSSDETVNSEVSSKSIESNVSEGKSSDDDKKSADNESKVNEKSDNAVIKENNNGSEDKDAKEVQRSDNNISEQKKSSSGITEENVSEKVKDYIINGQGDKSEAEMIKWSPAFLNQLNIESLYKQYKSSGGDSEDLKKFADYITLNAPIPRNWQELFEKDLYDTYGEKVSKLEHLQDDLYQAYVKIDNKEVPYVVVSSRTGYYHG